MASLYPELSAAEIRERQAHMRVFDAAFDEWQRRWELLLHRPGMAVGAHDADLDLFRDTWRSGYLGPEV